MMKFKSYLRNGASQLLSLVGLTTPMNRAKGRLSIATFHRVLPADERRAYPFPGLAVTPQEFDMFLAYFSEHFDCGPLESQHERYLSREPTERPLLAVTFDDGQFDNFRYARPILARRGIKASFFIPVEAVQNQEALWHDRLGFSVLKLLEDRQGSLELLRQRLVAAGVPPSAPEYLVRNTVSAAKALPLADRLKLVRDLRELSGDETIPEFARLMNFGEIAQLASEGHEIGSHSMTHCLMPECDDLSLAYELGESRRVLQDQLTRPVDSFCYPNGNADQRTATAAAAAGYRRAVTTDWGNNGAQVDPFRLRRFDMSSEYTCDDAGRLIPTLLAWRMSGLYPGLG